MSTDRLTITALIAQLESIRKEVGCDGVKIGSHNLPSGVSFYVEGPNDYDLVLDHLDVQRVPGCGCWSGVCFTLKEETPANLVTVRRDLLERAAEALYHPHGGDRGSDNDLAQELRAAAREGKE